MPEFQSAARILGFPKFYHTAAILVERNVSIRRADSWLPKDPDQAHCAGGLMTKFQSAARILGFPKGVTLHSTARDGKFQSAARILGFPKAIFERRIGMR